MGVCLVCDKKLQYRADKYSKNDKNIHRTENGDTDNDYRYKCEKLYNASHHTLYTVIVAVAGVSCFLIAVHKVLVLKIAVIHRHYLAVLKSHLSESCSYIIVIERVAVKVQHSSRNLYYGKSAHKQCKRSSTLSCSYHIYNEFRYERPQILHYRRTDYADYYNRYKPVRIA